MAKKPAPKQAARKAPAKAKPASKATPREKRSYAADYPRDYANGQHAARSGIPKEQAPAFFHGDQGKAWLEGYESRNG